MAYMFQEDAPFPEAVSYIFSANALKEIVNEIIAPSIGSFSSIIDLEPYLMNELFKELQKENYYEIPNIAQYLNEWPMPSDIREYILYELSVVCKSIANNIINDLKNKLLVDFIIIKNYTIIANVVYYSERTSCQNLLQYPKYN